MIFSDFFSKRSGANLGEIEHDELAEALQSRSCVLVDVREPHEFSAGHVPGSINHPLSRFEPHQLPAGEPVVLICGSGKRSASALSRARAAGLTAVRHYPGGVMGWRREGGQLS
jgi:rhodanese-related sulfurtransferase